MEKETTKPSKKATSRGEKRIKGSLQGRLKMGRIGHTNYLNLVCPCSKKTDHNAIGDTHRDAGHHWGI